MTLLWIGSLAFILYTYFGYPLVLWLWAFVRPRPQDSVSENYNPKVTVVIAAFNEESCIGETIASILASNYPAEALDVVVVSDASTDRTDEIVSSFPKERVQLKRQEPRAGQGYGHFVGAQIGHGDIVILADASGTFLPDTVRRLAHPFSNPKVGGVSGMKRIRQTGSASSQGDGLFTRYDWLLRSLESRTGSSWVGCNGGLFAVRTPLYDLKFPRSLAADNATCYEMYEKVYLHLFDPHAVVLETPSQSLRQEFDRKVRIIVKQLQGIVYFRRLFVPWKHPVFFFQNVSHKIFRWLVPFALIMMWVGSFFSPARWAWGFFLLQSDFYALALIAWIWSFWHHPPKILSIPAYFVAVNAAGLLAWVRAFRDYSVWTPPGRDENHGAEPPATQESSRE